MKIGANELCPCQSMKKYKKCCKIFHNGTLPTTAEALMRSRYSAFASNNAKYIMETTHEHNSDFTLDIHAWQTSILDFCKSTSFNGLDIINKESLKDEAYVTFFAQLSSSGKDCSFREKSKFLKVQGKWLYHSGVFLDD